MTTSIGKYRIQGEIGRGGFGVVYRAFDPSIGRAVALKVLSAESDPDLLARFHNEARAAGSIRHPNIVSIYDVGDHNGTPYMVMPLLEGHTLQDVITGRHPATLLEKLDIMAQVAEGLHHAHQAGIVHRDIKPSNIMILPDGTVQIMDFGIARLTAAVSRHTRTGFVIGTVLYLSPEQFRGETADHLADIWAYGVMYYEVLTGTNPFAAGDQATVLYRILQSEPAPVRSLNPAAPPALEQVVHRALAKDRELRYQSLRELQYDVQPVLVELRCGRACELAGQAKDLAAKQQFREAMLLAEQSLALDPGNRDAHTLLTAIRPKSPRPSPIGTPPPDYVATYFAPPSPSPIPADPAEFTRMFHQGPKLPVEQVRPDSATGSETGDLQAALEIARQVSRVDPNASVLINLLGSAAAAQAHAEERRAADSSPPASLQPPNPPPPEPPVQPVRSEDEGRERGDVFDLGAIKRHLKQILPWR